MGLDVLLVRDTMVCLLNAIRVLEERPFLEVLVVS